MPFDGSLLHSSGVVHSFWFSRTVLVRLDDHGTTLILNRSRVSSCQLQIRQVIPKYLKSLELIPCKLTVGFRPSVQTSECFAKRAVFRGPILLLALGAAVSDALQ